jgi:hypothetical protein
MRQLIEAGWANTPDDARHEITNLFASDDDWVCLEYTVRGTVTKEFTHLHIEHPVVGQKLEMRAVDVFRMRHGKIVTAREYYDHATLMRQLGIEPTKAARALRAAAPAASTTSSSVVVHSLFSVWPAFRTTLRRKLDPRRVERFCRPASTGVTSSTNLRTASIAALPPVSTDSSTSSDSSAHARPWMIRVGPSTRIVAISVGA